MSSDTVLAEKGILAVPFRGLFSEFRSSSVGSGVTRKRSTMTLFWYTERLADDLTTIQSLNRNFVPCGPKQPVSPEHVVNSFTPEPILYQRKVMPQITRLEKTLKRGDDLRKQDQLKRAEIQYGTALSLDENNVRACFGIGIVHARLGNREKTRAILDKLLSMDEFVESGYCTALFNEFGIALRKRGMYGESLRFYSKCLGTGGRDDHLLFNISRVYLEQRNTPEAMACLDKALAINPGLVPARRMRHHLKDMTAPA